MPHFTSNGLSLGYDDIPAPSGARTVVLVHGFASNRSENWRRLGWYGAFERKNIRVLALGCRGHGDSAKPHDPALYSRAAMTGDILALMDHAGVERANLLGYSMGARLALSAGLTYPERFSHLVAGGIGGRLLEPREETFSLHDAMEADDPATISDPLARSFRDFADEQGEDRLALAAFARATHEPFTRELLSGLRVPTLIVAGARDALAGDPEELARAIPGARSVTLPGCDHFSAIPHALFKASVFDFFDDALE